MKKIYILGPLVGVLLFAVVYWNFSKDYAAKVQAKELAVKKQREDKLRAEAESRKAAIEEALALQEQRKKERAEKEEKDRLEKEARQAAVDARDKAYRDSEKLAKQVDRLTKEMATEKEEIAKVEGEKKRAVDEEAFLRQYVTAAEGNVKSLEQVLQRIQAADKAAEEAAKAAASKKS